MANRWLGKFALDINSCLSADNIDVSVGAPTHPIGGAGRLALGNGRAFASLQHVLCSRASVKQADPCHRAEGERRPPATMLRAQRRFLHFVHHHPLPSASVGRRCIRDNAALSKMVFAESLVGFAPERFINNSRRLPRHNQRLCLPSRRAVRLR